MTHDSGNIKVEVPKGVDGRTGHMLERCVAICGSAAGSTDPGFKDEVSDLIDMRKVNTKNYVTGRWVLTIKTDKQGAFLKAKGQMGIEIFPG